MKLRPLMQAVILCCVVAGPLFGQNSGNCFLNDFESKTAVIPPSVDSLKPTGAATITVTINTGDTLGKVSGYLYGNNANLWMGQMVTEADLLGYLRSLSPHILRFPGGNISSVFFWDAPDGQPPNDVPDTLFDSNGAKTPAGYWYGKNAASWTLSVDNYYGALALTGTTGIITVNYSYARYGTGPDPAAAAAHLAADWVRYDNGRTKFWEIGNESAGSWQAGYEIDTALNRDGQPRIITGDIYGRHFLVFADSMRKAALEIGATIYIGAQLIEYDATSSSEPKKSWNSGFFARAGNAADFFIVHSYYTPYNENSTAASVLSSAAANTDNIMNYMKQTTGQNKVVLKPVALTEWNIFAVGSKQMTSFINSMHAAIVLGELATSGFSMASRWDLANGYDSGNDQGMFNVGDEPGVPKWNPRPAFFTMYYFQRIIGDHIVSAAWPLSRTPTIAAYASTFLSRHMGALVANVGTKAQVVALDLGSYVAGDRYYVYSLTGGTDNGEFSQVVYVNGTGPSNATGGPIDSLGTIPARAYPTAGGITVASPARSVQFILIEPGPKTAVRNDRAPEGAGQFILTQNYPNPFNPGTTISYWLPRTSNVTLKVFDIMGREVATLVQNEREATGSYEARFDASHCASGVYFYRLLAGGFVQTRSMLLIK